MQNLFTLVYFVCKTLQKSGSTSSPEPSPHSKWWIRETLGQGCQNGSKNSWHNEMSSFRLNNGFSLQENKQGRQLLETTSGKAISSCVRWQNTPLFLQYFSSLGQGFLRSAILIKEKALETRLNLDHTKFQFYCFQGFLFIVVVEILIFTKCKPH